MKKFIKTGTYSVMHMSVAIMVAYMLSGDWRIALGIGFIEPIVQTVFYHLHETFWSHKEKAEEINTNLSSQH